MMKCILGAGCWEGGGRRKDGGGRGDKRTGVTWRIRYTPTCTEITHSSNVHRKNGDLAVKENVKGKKCKNSGSKLNSGVYAHLSHTHIFSNSVSTLSTDLDKKSVSLMLKTFEPSFFI